MACNFSGKLVKQRKGNSCGGDEVLMRVLIVMFLQNKIVARRGF